MQYLVAFPSNVWYGSLRIPRGLVSLPWIYLLRCLFYGAELRFLEWLNRSLIFLGIPGLFLIALLDSAAIPMVGGPDAVVVLLSWQRPALAWLIAIAAALGSTAGCFILYRIGRAGGELALARLAPERRDWIKRKIEANAVWAIFVAVTAPPPFPTKPFVLAAGVFRTPLGPFTAAVLSGRLVRYSLMAILGSRFGDRASQLIKARYPVVLAALAGIVLLILLVRHYRESRRQTPS
jgi:membrane protein YqaA with SNARE-associated domain